MRIYYWLVVIIFFFLLEIGLVANSHYITHTIAYGETLWSISRKYKIPYSKLLACNSNIDPKNFKSGMTIRIPKYQRNSVNNNNIYVVQHGDTLWSIARKFSLSPSQIAKYNNLSENHRLKVGKKIRIPTKNSYIKQANLQNSNDVYDNNQSYTNQTGNSNNPLAWPVKGTLIENYGKNDHVFTGGIKIKSYQQQIYVAKKGRVMFVGIVRGYGLTIMINHGNGLVTAYSSKQVQAVVQVGSYLKKGRVIAVRQRGYSNTTLFFQVWQDNTLKNPINYLK